MDAGSMRLFVSASHPAVTRNACETGDRPEHGLGFLLRITQRMRLQVARVGVLCTPEPRVCSQGILEFPFPVLALSTLDLRPPTLRCTVDNDASDEVSLAFTIPDFASP